MSRTRRLGWLGFHRLSALYTKTKRGELSYRHNWQVDNTLPGVFTAGTTAAARQVFQVWYIGDPVLVGDRRGDYSMPPTPTFSNRKTTSTRSLVFHATKWLRFFGSRSENFAATAPRTDNLWRPISPQNGLTDEAGAGLSLFGGKVNLKVAAFQGTNALASETNTSAIASLEQGKVMGYGANTVSISIGGLDGVTGPVSDPSQPHYHKPIFAGGAFVGYTRKLFGDRVRWRAQLHAQNLFGEHGLRVISLNADQSPVWGISPPRAFELSNSFDF